MLRAAARIVLAVCLAATTSSIAAVSTSAAPNLSLDRILAEPPTPDFQELDSSTPGILEGAFDAEGYAAAGGANTDSIVKTLKDDGFVAGYGRAWAQPSQHHILLEIVVAFTGGKGATRWLLQSEQADLADPTYQHPISADGIDHYYGARMSDSASYFADAFVFVKGNDGFLVSTISDTDNLGNSAAAQARIQYDRAPEYTIPPSGWPGAPQSRFSVAQLIALAPRVTAGLLVLAAVFWIAIYAVALRPRRVARQDAGVSSGL
jgi:hypothetical protein